ncbi:bifunctional diguanylate cyclase/phosphodiesterase [Mycobacterium sp. NAZ190054]|uniref:putative bifunctional diguanylate cyclase/phosphodiesterase n=1 Tax=Mycobacterium sp. NAZ190054 TaxID=1747766 RepID=UPI0007920960|nr:bifunctional diguanylate cyclase/phosphodiesterase [Mycobacterium sp. NAZ190054]KWX67323.1 diguanylate phosphodiesterase [Mycobacterium sp. NAZ190054]
MGWVRAGRTAVKRAQMWPGIATPTLMARTAGAYFLVGGVLVALVTALASDAFRSAAVQYGNAAVAVFVGVCVLLIGPRLSLRQFHLLVLTAIALITLSVNASTGPVAVSFATLYVFVACAAFFVAWPAAVVHMGLAIACCLTTLALTPAVPWWTGAVTAATTAAIGTAIVILGRIVSKAELDEATGVPNRRGFDRAVNAEIKKALATGHGPAVVLMSVDGHAAIHEEFGDRAGDAVMQQLVAAWRSMLAPGQVLARRGDDEFALLLPETTEQRAFELTELLRAGSSREFSAGVSAWSPGESASPVLARADTALRRARSIGRNRTMLESSRLPPLARQLSDALAAETIGVHYQPVVRLTDDDAVVGVEALLRWSPALGSELHAGEVIRVAEDNELIGELDQYVLRRACLDACWMQQQSAELRMTLSVNVSGLELVEPGYVDRVVGTLAVTGWPARQLVLEVTESVLDVDRPSSIKALIELRRHGIRIAIDDFGTGYSSLSRLQKLPTDLLKLDASFTASITPAPSPPPLLQAVAGLADALGLPFIAEGVETEHQADVLRAMGCPLAQGYHFGRPQPREAVVAAIARATR